MDRQYSIHTMSDSSSDDDGEIGIPLAQRLANMNSALQPTSLKTSSKRKKSDNFDVSVVRMEPAANKRQKCLVDSANSGQSRINSIYAHSMSDSDDLEELPDLKFPTKSASSFGAVTSKFKFQNRQKENRVPKVAPHALSDSDSDGLEAISCVTSMPSVKIPKSTAVQRNIVTNHGFQETKAEEKKRIQETKKLEKDVMKRQKEAEREEKRKMKELEAKRKRIEREQKKVLNKDQCMKYMSVCIDDRIIHNPCGAEILMVLKNAGIKYDVQKQSYPNIITFYRETIDVIETENNIRTENKEILEDNILIWLPIDEFIAMVNNHVQKQLGNFVGPEQKTLRQFVEMAKVTLENRSVTLLVQGLENYFKTKNGAKRGKSAKTNSGAVPVKRLEVDQVLMDLQVCTSCNVRLMEKDSEVAQTVMQFTKSIAETPFKRALNAGGIGFHIDNKGSVKVDRDGTGLLQLWRQQITQFHNITGQVADAIIREYPSPMLLYQAYRSCDTDRQKERLLEDIMVRRVHGPVQSSRRVGKEMSRRMCHLFNETDPNVMLN